jgi:hypothetical protein
MSNLSDETLRSDGNEPQDGFVDALHGDSAPGIETFLTLRQASNLLPGRPSTCSLFRWARYGYGPQKIRLAYSRLGKKILVSRAAIDEFSARLIEAEKKLPKMQKPAATRTTRNKEARRRTPEERRIAAELARKRGGF